MYGVMIVDDEDRIRQGLTKLIEWEEYGLEVIAEAANGKAALEKLDEMQINIVITDIKMPLMDGIKLIQEIHNRKLGIRIIVLSGYDDFSFVKNAMKCGAENYLLKPINKEELLSTIKDMLEDMETKRLFEIQNRAGLVYLRNNTLNHIIKNEIKLNELRDKSELLELDIIWKSNMQIAIIQPQFVYRENNSGSEGKEILLSSIFNICEKSIEQGNSCIIFTDSNSNIVFILDGTVYGAETIKSELIKCQKNMLMYLKIHSSAAVGNLVESHRNLHQSYEQALKALDYKIVYGHDKVIFYSDIQNHFERSQENIFLHDEWIANCITALQKDELVICIDKIFSAIKIQSGVLSPEQIRNITMKLIINILHKAREFYINTEKIMNHNEYMVFGTISQANDIEELKRITLDIGLKVIEDIQQLQNRKYSKLVSHVISYIEENFSMQDICLKTLANQMDISAVHLGRTFKNETGIFFSDYLNRIRIQEAKKMLLETNIKIRDITEKVGFVNTSYFFTVFKKFAGVTPGEIRQV